MQQLENRRKGLCQAKSSHPHFNSPFLSTLHSHLSFFLFLKNPIPFNGSGSKLEHFDPEMVDWLIESRKMKQRKATHQKSVYNYNKWKKRKIFVMLSLLLLLGFCLVLTHNSTPTNTTRSRILTLASLRSHFIVQKPKIAFLFIARNRLPLDMLWDAFFKVFWISLPIQNNCFNF